MKKNLESLFTFYKSVQKSPSFWRDIFLQKIVIENQWRKQKRLLLLLCSFVFIQDINLESSYQENYLWDMLAWGWCMTRMGTLDLPPTKGHWCVGGGGFSDVQITMIWNDRRRRSFMLIGHTDKDFKGRRESLEAFKSFNPGKN